MKWRAAGPADRQLAALWSFVAVAVVAAVPLASLWSPHLPACAFRAVTGVACPSCGATRAIEALADGNLLTAFSLNPLVVTGLLAFVTGGLLAPIWNRRVGRLPDLRGVVSVRVGLAAVLLSNWVYVWLRGV
jgi:hypothetical protein